MGASSTTGCVRPKLLTALLDEMEDLVKDAVFLGKSNDPILANIINLAVASINESRPIVEPLLKRPVFFEKYILKWTREGLDEVEKSERHRAEALGNNN